MQLFDLLRIICRQAHEHGQADKADDAVEPGERQEHGDEPEYQKEDQPGRQDRTQAGKVALGEPAVGLSLIHICGEFDVGFAIAAILMLLVLCINGAAKLVEKKLRRKTK